jgi:hypothetical protein
MADGIDKIKELFPLLAYLVNDPEVGALLRDATDDTPFSETTFQAKLQSTRWFQTQSNSQREWQMLANTNRGEANQRRSQMRAAIDSMAARMGIRMSGNERNLFAELYLQRGMSADDPLVMQDLAHWAGTRGAYKNGEITTRAREVNRAYKDQWIDVGMKHNVDTGSHIVTGKTSMETVQEDARAKAMEKYWWLKPQLEKGMTMSEIFRPLQETIAAELEVTPDQIKMRDRKWSRLVHHVDGKSGENRMGTLYEAQTLARQQDAWWGTKNGRATDASLQNRVAELFGVRKGVA